jgi:signal transduction histidine kinase
MVAKPTSDTGTLPPDLSELCLAVTGHAPLPMAAVEGTGHIVRYVNSAFCRLLDKPMDQLVGKLFCEILPEKEKCVTLLDSVFSTGNSGRHAELQQSKPHPVFWSFTMWPVRTKERPVGVMIQVTEITQLNEKTVAMNEALLLGSVRQHELKEAADGLNLQLIAEITERKRADHELVAAKDEISHHVHHLEETVAERTGQLRETIRELEEFSYSVSHDMRAPLRAMQSYSQYLVDEYGGKLDAQGVNYLQQIMRSAIRLDRLIQDVLSYTKILHSPLPMYPVDLDRLVRDIIAIYPNGQTIKPDIHIEGRLPKVVGNEALLTQCISNLLSNGAKFVAPGTVPRLEISAETLEDSMIRVWFKDNGIGIAPENHERIFGLLERIHPVTEYEGTGIGLTIVRKAVERMGAQVGFESELGKGTKFWIQFKKA